MEILDKLNDAQLGVSVQGTASDVSHAQTDEDVWWEHGRVGLSVVLFVAAIIAGTLESPAGHGEEELFAYDIQKTSAVLALVSVAVGFYPVLYKACYVASYGVVDVNTLMAFAVLGALVGNEWLEAAAVVAIFALAERLEDLCMRHVRDALSAATAMTPQMALLVGRNEEVPVTDIKVGDVIAAGPGDMVVVDGKVVKGGGAVDESALTGEAMSVAKEKASLVYGGTIVVNGYIEYEAVHDASASTLQQIQQLVEEAQASESDVQRTVDRFAQWYMPLVIVATLILMGIVPVALGGGAEVHKEWLKRGLVILVMACPCALVMAAPVPVVCAIAACAQRQVLVKSAAGMERLAKVEHLVLDKTGTITEGRFRVTDTLALGAHDEQHTLKLAAALETKSRHPLADAIVNAAVGCVTEANGGDLAAVSGFKVLEGVGVSGRVEDPQGHVTVKVTHADSHIGRIHDDERRRLYAFMEAHQNDTVILVQVEGEAALGIALADPIRPASRMAVEAIHGLQVGSVMLTGDSEGTATTVQGIVGVQTAHWRQSPSDKLHHVRTLQKEGKVVAVVGDGINDGPALAAADVGLAMGAGGTALAAQSAEVVLMSDDLSCLPEAILLARSTRAVIWQNITFAVAVKCGMIGLAMAGSVQLWMAVLADVLGLVIVVLNGARVLSLYPAVQEATDKPSPQLGEGEGEEKGAVASSVDGLYADSVTITVGVAETRNGGEVPTHVGDYGVNGVPRLDLQSTALFQYRCGECGRGFARPGGLEVHMLSHAGSSPPAESSTPAPAAAPVKAAAVKSGGG